MGVVIALTACVHASEGTTDQQSIFKIENVPFNDLFMDSYLLLIHVMFDDGRRVLPLQSAKIPGSILASSGYPCRFPPTFQKHTSRWIGSD